MQNICSLETLGCKISVPWRHYDAKYLFFGDIRLQNICSLETLGCKISVLWRHYDAKYLFFGDITKQRRRERI